jgi:hypothetical protein
MITVQRQIASYTQSLEKLRLLRKELQVDEGLSNQVRSGPEAMMKLLVERGIPENLATGMAAEDFQDRGFGERLGLGGALGEWYTGDCCCTACCITCVCTAGTIVINR